MNLLNQTLDQFSTQIAEGVSFNPDIFEANLINLIILVGGLFYLLSGADPEEHTSELQSRSDLVCRLLLEKKKK